MLNKAKHTTTTIYGGEIPMYLIFKELENNSPLKSSFYKNVLP
jgi:hypothetical protein